jgi:hypothetical protein
MAVEVDEGARGRLEHFGPSLSEIFAAKLVEHCWTSQQWHTGDGYFIA